MTPQPPLKLQHRRQVPAGRTPTAQRVTPIRPLRRPHRLLVRPHQMLAHQRTRLHRSRQPRPSNPQDQLHHRKLNRKLSQRPNRTRPNRSQSQTSARILPRPGSLREKMLVLRKLRAPKRSLRLVFLQQSSRHRAIKEMRNTKEAKPIFTGGACRRIALRPSRI